MIQGKTKQLVTFSMFAAIILLLAFTPIGYIQLAFIKATIIHVPVIIGAIVLGPKYGAGLGLLFGITSLVNNTISPAISSFVFSPLIPVPGTASGSPLALLVCFVPRILVGVVPYYVYKLMQRILKSKADIVSFTVAGVLGSMTNTLLVMHLIYFLFQDAYATVQNVGPQAVYGIITGIIVANGIPEAIVAGVLVAAICKAITAVIKKPAA
ncbi:ECF transporter S component [Christensenellaceae bacterium OttesenSCG-928-L17]|nr:ECF transporter S component [Christensenellaceae bacterium OttesenSCG-928-L17]